MDKKYRVYFRQQPGQAQIEYTDFFADGIEETSSTYVFRRLIRLEDKDNNKATFKKDYASVPKDVVLYVKRIEA